MPYDLGDTVRLTADSKDPGGILTNAATVALTITLPDGTTVSPSVTNPPSVTGRYQYDYATSQAGRHTVRWLFTTPSSAYTDSFDVRPAAPPAILSLADAKKHLNITSTTDDDEIRGWVESVTAGIESLCGPVVVQTVTEQHRFRRAQTIVLRRPPVLSLTSVTAVLTAGTSYDVADLTVDPATGVVERLDGGMLYGPLSFVYEAGRRIVPAAMTSAARIILQHLWRTQRGSARGPAVAGSEDYSVTEPIPGLGYAIPNRALQLLEPYRLPPGVA